METIFDKLRRLRSPIVYDAIERFGLRPRQDGYTDGSVKCILPSLGAFVGYAVTGRIMAELPHEAGGPRIGWEDVWTYIERQKRPSIMVCQDMDQPPARGCAWGDVSASIFRRLGCNAVITNGAVRDIRQVEELGFGLFAHGPVVGHANVRFVEIGGPVKVGGLTVHPGEILHADEHGAVIIPAGVDLEALVRIADQFMASERRIIDYAQTSATFSVTELRQLMDRHDAAEYQE